MKEKAPVIIMLATTLGLGILLVVQHNGAKAREKTTVASHQKQVKGLEGQIARLTQNLKGNVKELSAQTEEAGSLGAKLAASETKVTDTSEKLENTTKAHDKALEDLAEKDVALKQNQQELLDTKANVAAVEVKLGDKAKGLKQAETELAANKKALAQASAKLADATAKLTHANGELEKKNETLIAALKDLEDGQARIAKLETDLQAVNQQVGGLRTQIGSLEQGIETTQKKLDAAEGDRAFLLRELKRMQDEKAELEKHLNNLEYVRTQYKKLKSEWAASERLRMVRDGIGFYGKKDPNEKGVASLRKLARRDEKSTSQAATATDVNSAGRLDVELRSDRTVIIVQPGEKPRVVAPRQPKAPELSKPSEKEAPKPAESIKPKGVVTPASESVLPKLETKPAASPVSKPKAPATKPDSTKIEPSLKPAAPIAPESETPASKPTPAETKPTPKSATPPVSKPRTEKPAPETKSAPKPVAPSTPKLETPPASRAAPAETKPTSKSATPPVSGPKSEKLAPEPKPASKPGAPAPKPVPANP